MKEKEVLSKIYDVDIIFSFNDLQIYIGRLIELSENFYKTLGK